MKRPYKDCCITDIYLLLLLLLLLLPSDDSSCRYDPVRYRCTRADLPLLLVPRTPCVHYILCPLHPARYTNHWHTKHLVTLSTYTSDQIHSPISHTHKHTHTTFMAIFNTNPSLLTNLLISFVQCMLLGQISSPISIIFCTHHTG